MTLKKSKAAKELLASYSPERNKIRSLLKKAAHGNASAFTQATSSYTNMISAYLYLCGYVDSRQRSLEIQKILVSCWRYLPYTKRVSDFERFLQVQLERVEQKPEIELEDQHTNLASLSHNERFLLVSRVFENWNFKSLKLAFRWKKRDLSNALAQLKCKLADFRLELLKPHEIEQVLRVNDLLEGEYADKQARKIEKELVSQYHAHQFKANWLSYRCELADLRLMMTLSDSEQSELIEEVVISLKLQPMERPRLSDSLINQISFIRFPSQA